MRNLVLLSAIFGFVFVSGWTGTCPVSAPGLLVEAATPLMTVEVSVPAVDAADALPALELALDQRCPELGPIAL